MVWYGLFMHFCGSNHEITQMQQEEIQQNQRSQINFMLMKIKTHQNFKFRSYNRVLTY